MPSLIIDKNQKGFKVVDFKDALSIGRGPGNNLIIEDVSISRNHAVIKKTDEGYTLTDTSRNGTLLNGERISTALLTHTDVFKIMDYNFSFIENMDEGKIIIENGTWPENDVHAMETLIEEPETLSLQQTINDQKKEHRELKNILKRHGIIAHHPDMLDVYQDIMELARINVPVLITGEPGTGKEKIAQALHTFSKAEGSLVALNCSAIPEGIFESELFGSVKGAFHDASNKPGKLEQAEEGTIFLDEIGDMAISIQPKLLRFLEDKKVTRLGDTKTKTINVRVVAATNQNLPDLIRKKNFRDDLFHRLACIKIHIPPLRKRPDDILPLADFFLTMFVKEFNLSPQGISVQAKQMLVNHNWPGNVRELKNVLLRAAIKSNNGLIEPGHLLDSSEKFKPGEQRVSDPFLSLEDIEKNHIIKALKRVDGNKAKAAKLLGISRDTLYKKISKYDL